MIYYFSFFVQNLLLFFFLTNSMSILCRAFLEFIILQVVIDMCTYESILLSYCLIIWRLIVSCQTGQKILILIFYLRILQLSFKENIATTFQDNIVFISRFS